MRLQEILTAKELLEIDNAKYVKKERKLRNKIQDLHSTQQRTPLQNQKLKKHKAELGGLDDKKQLEKAKSNIDRLKSRQQKKPKKVKEDYYADKLANDKSSIDILLTTINETITFLSNHGNNSNYLVMDYIKTLKSNKSKLQNRLKRITSDLQKG